MLNNEKITIVAHDVELPKLDLIKVLPLSDAKLASIANLFIFVSASALPDVQKFVTEANYKKCLRGLFIFQDVAVEWLPQMFDLSGLRSLKNTLIYQDPLIPQRIINAWAMGSQEQLIADATVINCSLFVLTCAMEKLIIPFELLPSIVPEERSFFTISDFGGFIHWVTPDIHFDLDGLRATIDKNYAKKLRQTRLTINQQTGKAIACLRKRTGLTQSQIPGLSERQVSRIENGHGTKTSTLISLATAHNMSLDAYLDELAKLIKIPPLD